MINVKIDGVDAIVKKYGVSIKPAIRRGVAAIAIEVEGQIKVYPAATAGNTPKTYKAGRWNTWYQRGFGSKWARANGSIGERKSSQTLGRRWQHAPRGELGQVVTNNASYAGFVHGIQTRFHKAHGWISEQAVVKKIINDGTIKKIINKFLAEALDA